ncbi:MAG: hypothetical protein KQH63_20810 [Desulfobulbaceae bacterium]|nr:hypothetical protein [Desulfobulbaceae bacterium]
MKEDLLRLITLQDIDLQIKELDDEMKAGFSDLEKRQSSIAAKKELVEGYTVRIQDNEQRLRELEAEMEDAVVHIKDRQTKLMNVQTNREYQSLLKEIEETKKANKDREEEIVHLMEKIESLRKKISDETNVCQSEEELLGEAQKEIEKKEKKLQTQKSKFEKNRTQQASKIPEPLSRRYDQLREKRNGLAIIGVKDGVCQGCFMNIPPQQFNEVLRGEQLLSCPTCQRLMYHQAEVEEN